MPKIVILFSKISHFEFSVVWIQVPVEDGGVPNVGSTQGKSPGPGFYDVMEEPHIPKAPTFTMAGRHKVGWTDTTISPGKS